jgi:hypothetical protein
LEGVDQSVSTIGVPLGGISLTSIIVVSRS